MQDALAVQGIESRYAALVPLMDERMRRQWAAAEAKSYGWGGVRAVACATGMSPNTIVKRLVELQERESSPQATVPQRLRVPGAGRKRATEADPELASALERLVDPATRGDPMSPLRWTCKSTMQLAGELTRQGHTVSPRTVGRLLRATGYSLQSNRKTKEGKGHPDRNSQFEHISMRVSYPRSALSAGHQQVEQDRTSHVLPHHTELARSPSHQPRRDHQSYCQHLDN